MNAPTILAPARFLCRGARRALPLAALAILAACGESATQPQAPAPRPFNEGEVQARIDNLQNQVDQLEGLSDTLRRDLDSIDATRLSITAQIGNLRQDLLGGKPQLPAVGAAAPAAGETPKPQAVAAAPAAQAAPAASAKKSGFFRTLLTIAFVAAIIAAVIYIGNIFLGRWGAPDADIPMVERQSDLGAIRYPASAEPTGKDESASDPKRPDEDDATGDYPPVRPLAGDED